MRSKIVTGAATALLAVVSIAAGLAAQEKPEPEQPGSAVRFTTLLNFDSTDGAVPNGALAQGTDGNLYGTTAAGGLYNQGTVFKMTPQGTLTTIYNFCAQTNCPDGDDPKAALALGTDGNLYGTTYLGGANTDACRSGCGVVFKITPAGAMTTLYSFCAQPGCADGAAPGQLVQGSDGNFYGTTEQGGSNTCENTCGTVFKITPAGALTTLYKFTARGGYSPDFLEKLAQGSDGNFYGTTSLGGSGTGCLGSCGTAFRITPEGALTTLYNFQGGVGQSENPGGQLVQATDGNFYGTAGGGYYGPNCIGFCGTIFKMTSEGIVSTLVSLYNNQGAGPVGLVQATDGNFYVVTDAGSACNCGTIFELTPQGVVTVLHDFSAINSGYFPFSGVVQATNGIFYGDTSSSDGGWGVIYSMSTGLGPFLESVPAAGKIGTTVTILGNNLKFATSVTFNGVAAAFTVESSTYIEATVPAGATTGPIVVTLRTGTLTSNVNFQVLP